MLLSYAMSLYLEKRSEGCLALLFKSLMSPDIFGTGSVSWGLARNKEVTTRYAVSQERYQWISVFLTKL